jgi:hypothetical protein
MGARFWKALCLALTIKLTLLYNLNVPKAYINLQKYSMSLSMKLYVKSVYLNLFGWRSAWSSWNIKRGASYRSPGTSGLVAKYYREENLTFCCSVPRPPQLISSASSLAWQNYRASNKRKESGHSSVLASRSVVRGDASRGRVNKDSERILALETGLGLHCLCTDVSTAVYSARHDHITSEYAWAHQWQPRYMLLLSCKINARV